MIRRFGQVFADLVAVAESAFVPPISVCELTPDVGELEHKSFDRTSACYEVSGFDSNLFPCFVRQRALSKLR